MIQRLAAALLLAWVAGFVLFAIDLPHPAGDAHTDGIVVLTGGPGRLARGAALLADGRADRMLVSGVDRRVRPGELARTNHLAGPLLARIDLGQSAVDTRSNARETAAWIAAHHYRSIRLVTTDWHMARARFELARVLRGIRIVPDPVPSEPGLVVLVAEYDKYLLRRLTAFAGW